MNIAIGLFDNFGEENDEFEVIDSAEVGNAQEQKAGDGEDDDDDD